jgi:hypothetical protein
MRISLYALAAVALGLLAGTAKACDYNRVAVVNTVAVNGYVNTVQTVAVPVQTVLVTPTVNSFVAVTPTYGYGGYGVNVVNVNRFNTIHRDVLVVERNVKVVKGNDKGGSGVVGVAKAVAKTARNVVGAVIGR